MDYRGPLIFVHLCIIALGLCFCCLLLTVTILVSIALFIFLQKVLHTISSQKCSSMHTFEYKSFLSFISEYLLFMMLLLGDDYWNLEVNCDKVKSWNLIWLLLVLLCCRDGHSFVHSIVACYYCFFLNDSIACYIRNSLNCSLFTLFGPDWGPGLLGSILEYSCTYIVNI